MRGSRAFFMELLSAPLHAVSSKRATQKNMCRRLLRRALHHDFLIYLSITAFFSKVQLCWSYVTHNHFRHLSMIWYTFQAQHLVSRRGKK